MKPDYRILQDGDKILGVYDITKISMICKIDDRRYQIIIDGQFFTFTFPTKDICDSNFNDLIKEIAKINNKQDQE